MLANLPLIPNCEKSKGSACPILAKPTRSTATDLVHGESASHNVTHFAINLPPLGVVEAIP